MTPCPACGQDVVPGTDPVEDADGLEHECNPEDGTE